MPFLTGISIHDEPFLTTLTQFVAAVTEASMIADSATSAFTQGDLAATVITAVNAALPKIYEKNRHRSGRIQLLLVA